MAKRKRLSLPEGGAMPPLETKAYVNGWAGERRAAPVADMAGAAAAHAALEELADDIRRARAEGRMVVEAPLEAIDEGHLLRDRLALDAGEMDALKASLAARGQQTPLDVVEAGPERYGLISGWRRLTALKALHAETGDARFSRAICLVRRPDDAGAAYLAMVEENEIRAGLSYYERAAVAARAAGQGAFADTEAALAALFGAVSKAKRSKIRSFVTLWERLDDTLAHPAAIPERLGLALVRALGEEAGFEARLRAALAAAPERDAEAERAILEAALKPARPAPPPREEVARGVFLEGRGARVVLTGPGVDDDLRAALRGWLAAR